MTGFDRFPGHATRGQRYATTLAQTLVSAVRNCAPASFANLDKPQHVTATRAGGPAFGNSLLLLTKSRRCAGQNCFLGPRKTHAFDAETLLAGGTFDLRFLEVVAPALARAYFSANRSPSRARAVHVDKC